MAPRSFLALTLVASLHAVVATLKTPTVIEEMLESEMDEISKRPAAQLVSQGTRAMVQNHDAKGRPTADYFMRNTISRAEEATTCLPELGGIESFAAPANTMPTQLSPSGKVFLVGDSVIGQICQLGSPGLCCSSQRPCSGPPAFTESVLSPWEIQLDRRIPYADKGWQHLFEFRLRSANNTAKNQAFFVAPEVHDDPGTVETSVNLVTNFLAEKGTTNEDLLVLGMVGTHYNHGLSVFNSFVNGLITKVVNPFPGRVVLLGYGPQHFAGAGHYTGMGQACAPNPLPSDVEIPRNSFRSAIFLRNVWSHLTQPRSRLVDFSDMLAPLWACHRQAGDCTHWKDPVISLQAQLILNALEKIE